MPPKRPVPDPLVALREEIESVDRSITLLLAARVDAAQRAIRWRSTQTTRIVDPEQEGRVLRRSRDWAIELGLPPKLVDHLFRALIAEGKARFLSHSETAEPPVVTVLLADPTVPVSVGERQPGPELVAVPASR
jgi:chorismate mutase